MDWDRVHRDLPLSRPGLGEGVIAFTPVRYAFADLYGYSSQSLPKNMHPEGLAGKTAAYTTWAQYLVTGGLKTLHFHRRAAQAIADSITRRLFLAAYEASDDAYWRSRAPRYEWRSLGGIIEFAPDFLAVADERKAPVYLIAIRAAQNADLKRVSFKVKAKKGGVIHEQEITQRSLSGIPVRKALTSIPLKPKSSGGADWHKLGDIYIKLLEAVDSEGVDLVKGSKVADIFPSTGTEALPCSQVERWGQYWNIDAINVVREEIKAHWYRELVLSARKLGRPLTLRRTAYRLLTGRLALAFTFWSQNLWNAKGIRTSIAETEVSQRPIPSKKRGAATA